ncbi:MAG: hypothetical protein GAK30_02740 [Paracidovorax wautersii]|uniref:Entericidin EcnA/B family protein n=1 Tax=Paracidovorax wautersii TaxID=1177982 RepID=A0A7V8FME0_9BURK|nr:MAG: hypothetical protein GAK30_02740 [Paracidovorax wautersii]
MHKKLIAPCALVLLAAMLSGCNTVRGMGEDVQRAGSAIERAAK